MLLGISNGSEIAVQDFLRIDDDFLLARGRFGGTNDMGWVFCLPYDQLTFFTFTRSIDEQLLRSIFGELLHSLTESAITEGHTPAEQPAITEPSVGVSEPKAGPQEKAGASSLRERLLARLAGTADQRGKARR
jgi:hypothetical protein